MRRKAKAGEGREDADASPRSKGASASSSSSAAALASGLKYLVASQVATRAITFALNLLTTRLLTVDAYGVAAVQFHLINTTILLLAREGIRRGCITGQQGGAKEKTSSSPPSSSSTLKLAATAALSLPAGALVSAFVSRLFLRGVPDPSPHRTAVGIQVAAALVELSAEPLYVVAAVRGDLAPRVAGEALGTLARGVVSLALLSFAKGVDPGVALSLAQLCYALTWLLSHLAAFAPEVLRWRRREPPSSPVKKNRKASSSSIFLDSRALSLCGGFTLQAAEKLALAEGSKAVLAAADVSPAARGEFGLASNVGSLAVRTLFQPIEEAAFLAFAKKGDEREEKDTGSEVARANELLCLLCRCVALVGATGAAMGPPFAFALVRAAYGRRWACETRAPRALGSYALYTALLALNGVLEAFVHARGGPDELARGNAALLALAAAGAAAGALGARALGSVGLVAADAAAMAARIAWSLGAVGRLSRGAGGEGERGASEARARRKGAAASRRPPRPPRLRDLLPSPATLASLACASALGLASDALLFGGGRSGDAPSSFRCSLDGRRLLARTAAHGFVGVFSLACVAAVALKKEKETIDGIRALRSGKVARD